jgi:glutamate/tyrosine decarboxylase-like PLP-dependent enzyme
MDVHFLERLIDQDMAGKRIPCLVVVRAGTTFSGELDNIVAIKKISNYEGGTRS